MTNEELEQRSQSIARGVQAMMEQRVDKLKHDERMRFLAENQHLIPQTQRGIANLVGSWDEDRSTVLRKLTAIENKIDRIVEGK